MRPIPWFKADDKLHSHPKIAELPLEAMGIWILAGTWCADYLTDGRITLAQIRRLGGAEELAEALVDAGMWHHDGKHYIFKDWTDYQPTKSAVDAEREASRERQRLARERREQNKKGSQAPVTPMSQRDTPVNHAPVTEKFLSPVPEPVPEPVPNPLEREKPRKKSATAIPNNWEPTEAHQKKAQEKGVNLEGEAERFRLHAETHDRKCVNWNSAFTMWLSKARPETGPQRYLNSAEKKVEVAKHWLSQPAQDERPDPWAIDTNQRKEIGT